MGYTIEQTSRDVVTLRHNGVGAYWLEFKHDNAEHGRVTFDVARG